MLTNNIKQQKLNLENLIKGFGFEYSENERDSVNHSRFLAYEEKTNT